MSRLSDEQWEQHVLKARQELQQQQQARKQQAQQKPSTHKSLNLFLFGLSAGSSVLAALLTGPLSGLLIGVWLLGGFAAAGTLVVYATTDKVSFTLKEAALSFLLGNLVGIVVLALKPV